MEVSDIIALGSLLVAIIALIKSFLSDRKVKAIDLQLKQRELNKASLEDDENHKADVEVNVVEIPPLPNFLHRNPPLRLSVCFGDFVTQAFQKFHHGIAVGHDLVCNDFTFAEGCDFTAFVCHIRR